jgi:arylsulfatase A-like enzyme
MSSSGQDHPTSGRPHRDEDGADPALTRRTLLKRGLLTAGTLAGGGLAVSKLARAGDRSSPVPKSLVETPRTALSSARPGGPGPPNILVIVVDQLRSQPRWISASTVPASVMPNLMRLSREGVSFASHYTASNDCTPARSTLLTGLYTHQTGCMITGGSTLDPSFPTWGSMLREWGYGTYWYGKWHLTHHDNKWDAISGAAALDRYGFAGGTFPSPDGAPGQAWRVDPDIVGQFERWFARSGEDGPWCTTVSLVNPHDIAWWYKWSDRVAPESSAPRITRQLPANFETPGSLIAREKPSLQRSLQETAAQSFGPVPFSGPHAMPIWSSMLDLYAKLQREVDGHIGRVLQTLQSRPEVAANTVVVFTSDHGEYGGAHGLRGKGAGAYEEAIRVPLIVKDPRGVLTGSHRRPRHQLTSSVDVAPLLLSIASGSDGWRGEARYSHLSGRLDIARILRDPSAPGRAHVLHATDEVVTEFADELYAWNAPLHVVALRTPTAKIATYSNWLLGTTQSVAATEQRELYDYRTRPGRLELHNSAGEELLEGPLRELLNRAVESELRGKLPHHLRPAREGGLLDYFTTATHAAKGAAAARLARSSERAGENAHLSSAPRRSRTLRAITSGKRGHGQL